MSKESIKHKLLKNGDVEATITYPEREVEIQTSEGTKVIGKQPAYDVVNVIEKDKVPTLVKYLKEQATQLMKKVNEFTEVIKNTEGYDCPKLLEHWEKIPHDKQNTKKLAELNEVASRVKMRTDSEIQIVRFQEALDRIELQLEFFKEKGLI